MHMFSSQCTSCWLANMSTCNITVRQVQSKYNVVSCSPIVSVVFCYGCQSGAVSIGQLHVVFFNCVPLFTLLWSCTGQVPLLVHKHQACLFPGVLPCLNPRCVCEQHCACVRVHAQCCSQYTADQLTFEHLV